MKLYEQAAAAQQAAAGQEGAQTANNADDDVVDGEFTESSTLRNSSLGFVNSPR